MNQIDEYLSDGAEVPLGLGPQGGEEVLAVVREVDELWGRLQR